MSLSKLSKIYNEDYFERGIEKKVSNYAGYSWERLGFYFRETAKHIVDKFNPKTVLDAGCAKGYLVYALRQLGVDACGIDASEYAVSQALEEVKDRIKQGLIQKLPYKDNQFDVVICFDVMEHIPEDEVDKVLSEFVRVAKKYVVIRVPTRHEVNDLDRHHETVKPKNWWEKKLSKHFTVEKANTYFNGNVWWFNIPDYLIVGKKVGKKQWQTEGNNTVAEFAIPEE